MGSFALHDVFISYRRYEDSERKNPKGLLLAQAVYEYLTGKGLKVFWDKPEMQTGDFEAQLDWQLEHCPNYIFIATEGAKRFRPGEKDFVAHELKTALALYDKSPGDRVLLPVFPHMTPAEKQAFSETGPYTEEIQKLEKFHGVELGAAAPSADELRDILRFVTAINRRNMWNAGYQWLRQAKQARFKGMWINDALMPLAVKRGEARFPITVSRGGEDECPLMDVIRDAESHLYLIGAGGIGKTTALLRIMEEAYDEETSDKVEQNRLNGQIPLFIELSRAPDAIPDDRGREWQVYSSGRSTFIHREIYRQVRRDLRLRQIHAGELEQIDEIYKADYDVAVRPVANLLGGEKPAPEYLLLLDGLNEVSRREIKMYNARGELEFRRSVVGMVLDEIREIMKYKNVRVILTSRSREAAGLAENTELYDLGGVSPGTIREYLTAMNVPVRRIESALHNERLPEVLRSPLFLIMYAGLDGEEELLSAGEIMHLFYHSGKREDDGSYSQARRMGAVHNDVRDASENSEPASRLTPDMMRFILDFILPEIGWRMAKAQEFRIRRDCLGGDAGLDEIIEQILTDDDEKSVCGRHGRYVFSEYTTEACGNVSRFAKKMIEDLGGLDEAVDAVLYCAVYTLGVLYEADHEYGFSHHHLRDYFSAVCQINRLKLAVYLQGRGRSEAARECLEEWEQHPLPTMTRRFLGEALGEAHNRPRCDENGYWHDNEPADPCERNLIRRGFDLYRDRFDGQNGHSVWNLLQILKEVREDLSGEDFSRLDLRRCRVNGYYLSRKGLAARFTGAMPDDQFFMPEGHTDTVNSVVFSPDSRRIVTTSYDGTARVWDAETMQEIGVLSGHQGSVFKAAYSPDGRRIVTAGDWTARVWDAETMREIGILCGHKGIVQSAVYSPDGRRILTGGNDGTARLWDAETMREIGQLNAGQSVISQAVYSPDGKQIMIVSRDPKNRLGTLRIWNAETMREAGMLPGCEGQIYAAVYSPDGHRIVTVDDEEMWVWEAETLQKTGRLSGHTGFLNSAAWSPDGRRIVTAGIGGDSGVPLWDAETMQQIAVLRGHQDRVESVAWSPDGRRIATTSHDETTRVWDVETMQEIGILREHKKFVFSTAFHPDGHRMVTTGADRTAKVWDTGTMRLVETLNGHESWVYAAGYSPDGRSIVTASEDGTARVWNSETGQETGILSGSYREGIQSASFSPDGRRILTAGRDGTTRVWSAETLREIRSGLDEFWTIIAVYSPDGRRIATDSEDAAVRIWDAETLRMIGTLNENGADVVSIAWSPDGRRIVTACNDETVRVWNTETMQQTGKLRGHGKGVNYAAYSPDGRRIVTASDDETARVWDAETMQQIAVLTGHREFVYTASYSPDGRHIVTASTDGTAKVWDAETSDCLHTIYDVAGLFVKGVDLRHLHPDSRLSPEVLDRLYEYSAITDDRG